MSVTVELYEYDESMDDETLGSLGVKGGLLGQLTHDVDIEDETELLRNATSHTVGSNNNPFPRRVLEEVDGIQTVDTIFLQTIETALEELANNPDQHQDTLQWLQNRQGQQIFVKGL